MGRTFNSQNRFFKNVIIDKEIMKNLFEYYLVRKKTNDYFVFMAFPFRQEDTSTAMCFNLFSLDFEKESFLKSARKKILEYIDQINNDDNFLEKYVETCDYEFSISVKLPFSAILFLPKDICLKTYIIEEFCNEYLTLEHIYDELKRNANNVKPKRD